MPGYFLGEGLRGAPEAIETLLESPPPLPEVAATAPAYQAALTHFQERRALIEAYVHQHGHTDLLTTTYLSNANEDLGDNIEAALTLGDMDLLWANMSWVQGLLMNYHYRMPEAEMGQYMAVYRAGAENYLDERGQPILDWLSKLSEG
jgi:hypothetical protein